MFGDQGLVAIEILHTKNTCCWFSAAHCWSKTWSIENNQYFFPPSCHFGSPWSWIFEPILLYRSVYFIQSKWWNIEIIKKKTKNIQSTHTNYTWILNSSFPKRKDPKRPFWVYVVAGTGYFLTQRRKGTVLGAVHQLLLTESHQITTCQLPRLERRFMAHGPMAVSRFTVPHVTWTHETSPIICHQRNGWRISLDWCHEHQQKCKWIHYSYGWSRDDDGW